MTEHEAATETTAAPMGPPIEVAADIVAAIVRRRVAGELAADIGRDFAMTAVGVLDLIREVRRGERAAAPEIVELVRQTVPGYTGAEA
jgi:hypothetical protein